MKYWLMTWARGDRTVVSQYRVRGADADSGMGQPKHRSPWL